jgi:hypothetical protein
MAERPEDLNLPNAVITRIIKEAVSGSGQRMVRGRTSGLEGSRSLADICVHHGSPRSSRTVSTSLRRPGAPSLAPPASSCCTPRPGERRRAAQSSAGARRKGGAGRPRIQFLAWTPQTPQQLVPAPVPTSSEANSAAKALP